MDTFGQVFLVPLIALLIGGIVGFMWLRDHSPRAAFVVAFLLFMGKNLIDERNSRLLHGLVGVLTLVSIIGGVLAVIALAREPVGRRRDDQNPPPLP